MSPANILDISYFPAERGLYNYNTKLDSDGLLPTPEENFGAIVRGITADNDFDNANTEYLTFWLLDPFQDKVRATGTAKDKKNDTGGKLIFHLGDISEDFIPDNRNNFENGLLPTGTSASKPVATKWGKAPSIQYLTDAFDNQEGARAKQDIGLDGLSNAEETTFLNSYLSEIKNVVKNPAALAQIEKDPAGDDFKFFIDAEYDAQNKNLLQRFKNYLGLENNSPESQTKNSVTTPANSVSSDKEDLNADNTINDIENYFEYEIDLKPSNMAVGNGYIVDKATVAGTTNATWYLFRVPIKKPATDTINFKSIRFMRVLLTQFKDPVVLRFASLQLESNLYRNADSLNVFKTLSGTFKTGVVNIEENGCPDGTPNCITKDGKIPYVLPPDFVRDRDVTQQQFNIQFNEQSISLSADGLKSGNSRGVFKNTRLDLINYKRIKMFIHAENQANDQNTVGGAFVRFGTDLTDNYYEIEIPKLKITLPKDSAWYDINSIDVDLEELISLKGQRNREGKSLLEPFIKNTLDSKFRISVVGNPDLSTVLTMMLGLRNPTEINVPTATYTVWMNELRAFGFNQKGGSAGILSANIKLADLATVSITGNLKNFGFGGVQDKISERSRETATGFGIASNIQLDKLTPEKWGLRVPLFVNYDEQKITPHFNPLDPDMPLELALTNKTSVNERDRLANLAIDKSTRKGFNFSNVRKVKTKEGAKSHFYDIENFSFTYAQNKIEKNNSLIEKYQLDQYKGGITYNFQTEAKPWEPFKNNKSLDRPLFYWLKDFNLSLIPTVVALKTDFDRSFGRTLLRNSDPKR